MKQTFSFLLGSISFLDSMLPQCMPLFVCFVCMLLFSTSTKFEHRCIRLYKIKIWKTSKYDVDNSKKDCIMSSHIWFSNRLHSCLQNYMNNFKNFVLACLQKWYECIFKNCENMNQTWDNYILKHCLIMS